MPESAGQHGQPLEAVTRARPDQAALAILGRLAHTLGADDIAREVAYLEQQVGEGRFIVACLGQFKRGKSSLINGLIGMTVLPTGIIPITAVPTVVRYGVRLRARILCNGADWEQIEPDALERFVSERHNPENRLGVRAVELEVPSPMLEGGLCLVDTPGVGSVSAGNTAATHDYLPHVDVALVITGVDPPLSGEELSLVEAVAHVARQVLLVLNKADRFDDAQRGEAADFARRVLSARLGRSLPRALHVSATMAGRLTVARTPGQENGACGVTAPSGDYDWDALTATLRGLQRDSGRDLVRCAHDRGVLRLARRLGGEVAAQRSALLEPIEAGHARLDRLVRALAVASRKMDELGERYAGERKRLERQFAARRTTFITSTVEELHFLLDRALFTLPVRARGEAFRVARDLAHRALMPWLEQENREAGAAYAVSVARQVEFTNHLLADVRANAPDLLSRLPDELPAVTSFSVPSRYFYRELPVFTQISPLRALFDRILSPERARADVRLAVRDYLAKLLEMNSTLVLNDLTERMDESQRRLEGEVRRMFDTVRSAAERAVEQGRVAHAAGAAAVAQTLAVLEAADHDLTDVVRNLPQPE